MAARPKAKRGLSISRPLETAKLLLLDEHYWWHFACLLIVGDAVLTQLIIRFIRFTEIDYETYMEHIVQYIGGERNYSLFTGGTGALVYPAGHVYIHKILYHVTAGLSGKADIWLGQQIYAALYLATLALSCLVYKQAGSIPNYALIPLVLSKRLHSIYVLRLFNDCWAVFGLTAAIATYNSKRYILGSLLFSAALSVKMNILLYLPGLAVVLVTTLGTWRAIQHLALIAGSQLVVALPFITSYPDAYFAYAFNFGRAFLYKWTVNWRFVPEEDFLSQSFSRALLASHLVALVLFGLRWSSANGGIKAVITRALTRPTEPAGNLRSNADYFTTVLLISNLVGITFARSLHYQFYSWYARQIPFLLWRTKYPLVAKIGILVVIEYCWNVFPSTPFSSWLLLYCHLAMLAGLFFGYPLGMNAERMQAQREQQKKRT